MNNLKSEPGNGSSPLLVERSGALGKLILNLPKALNALNLDMIRLMTRQLDEWAADDSISCVWIEGSGDKALCAGGDVVALHRESGSYGEARSSEFVHSFFSEEYRLDYLIHTYAKPVVVWGNGIVMGGGIGIMAGASHRIVTETTRMAMPEITIGLFPDVGGSWFLNRMPGRCGLFLGLTGAQFNGADGVYSGMADRLLPSDCKDQLLEQLAAQDYSASRDQHYENNHALVSRCISALQMPVEQQPESNLQAHFAAIQQLTDHPTLPETYRAITHYQGDDKWLQKAAATLAAGCPLSAWIVWEQLRRSKHLSLGQVLQVELGLAINLCTGGQVKEGVRALLIDKDRNPQWQPATLDAVSSEAIEACFTAPWSGANPLADLR